MNKTGPHANQYARLFIQDMFDRLFRVLFAFLLRPFMFTNFTLSVMGDKKMYYYRKLGRTGEIEKLISILGGFVQIIRDEATEISILEVF